MHEPLPNHEIQAFWVKGVQLVHNGHNLAGFAIGALFVATMATLDF